MRHSGSWKGWPGVRWPASCPTAKILSLSLGLVVLSLVFWLIERWRPVPGPARRAEDTRADLAYWFFTPIVTRAITRVAIGVAFALIAWRQGVRFADLQRLVETRRTWITSWPLVVQVPLILVLADVLAYATHRIFHADWLWPFHAIHHSSPRVDWLSSVRLHPVNDALSRVAQVLPLYGMGFNGRALAAFVPFLTFYALLLHANVTWTYGPFRYLLASPVFHRWHHTSEEEGLDKNFAGLFPFIDLACGTFYMPKGRLPERFGAGLTAVPDGLVRQLTYPFRRNR
jgi:sterol desaturase/sphingolipid hydroxylase (fatty acid hydroxylase superfamily)